MKCNNFFSNLHRCFIIAEIGVNHNGDISLAKRLIDIAHKSGADAVKFQTYRAENLASPDTPKVRYQEEYTLTSESHLEMLKRLELSYNDHCVLKEYCEKKNIIFLSTPYDIDSAIFLEDQLNVPIFKTASADLIDHTLHKYISSTKKPTIISVGMSSLGEIEQAVEIYLKNKSDEIILLHTVSNYPCGIQSLNMNVMKTLRNSFHKPVGFSDHSIGYEAAIISIAFGAKVIEKHLTLDKNLPGPDHKASSSPEEFFKYVKSIRNAELMLGSYRKACQDEERDMLNVSRKSAFLKKDLNKGDILKAEDVAFKRPGIGISPQMIDLVYGRVATKNIKKDTLLSFFDFK